jgi:lipoprotein NlpI
MGEAAAAELETDAAKLKGQEWPYPVIELYLDRRSPQATFDAATKPDERCEVQFYIGEWHILMGDMVAAAPALQVAVDTCQKNLVEYFAAVYELNRLKR